MHCAELLCACHVVMVMSFHPGHLLRGQRSNAQGEQRGGCHDAETVSLHAE
jgi:hypothetical protein